MSCFTWQNYFRAWKNAAGYHPGPVTPSVALGEEPILASDKLLQVATEFKYREKLVPKFLPLVLPSSFSRALDIMSEFSLKKTWPEQKEREGGRRSFRSWLAFSPTGPFLVFFMDSVKVDNLNSQNNSRRGPIRCSFTSLQVANLCLTVCASTD